MFTRMRTPFLIVVFIFTVANAFAADPVKLDSKITAVTVYADRAQVTRQARIPLKPGLSQFVFSALPGWLDEGSIRVRIEPAGAGEVLDVQIERTFLERPTDEEFRKTEEALQFVRDESDAMEDRAKVLDAELKQVEAIRAFALDKAPKDAAARKVDVAEYKDTVDFISKSMADISKRRRELKVEQRMIEPRLRVAQQKLDALRQRAQLEQRNVIVTVQAAGDRETTLEMEGMLPGATWEPVHELRSTSDAKTLSVASHAVVSQTSGEDWTGVDLMLSTQRASDTLRLPELKGLLLGNTRALTMLVGKEDTYKVANANWAAQNDFYFAVKNPEKMEQQAFASNKRALIGNTVTVLTVFESLRERGTTAHFSGLGKQTVRADGRTVRVPIGKADLKAQPRIVVAPEVSLNAVRTGEVTNSTTLPLLPGKAHLFINGAFLGMSEMEFVSPSEPFSVFLGVADQIKVKRDLDQKRSEVSTWRNRTRMKVAYIGSVQNLSNQEVSVQLSDRIPVSEIGDVKVTDLKLSPSIKPDSQGLLNWTFTLAPRQTQEYRIEYALDYPTELPKQDQKDQPNDDLQLRLKRLEKALPKR